MNKKITISILSSVLLAGVIFLTFGTTKNKYTPRNQESESISGYFEFINQLRANQVTGTVSDADVAKVMAEIKNQQGNKMKTDWPLAWEFGGPDNFGGRTRCLVIDKDDANVMYTGGVSGGLFKTNNKGASWFPLNKNADHFGVVSMAQTSDGAIYYGTGEGAFTSAQGEENGTPGFSGSGIYKSTNGETFTKLLSSSSLGYISVLKSHPSKNEIYAGTQSGLRYSSDGGTTWQLVRAGSCRDIAFNTKGEVIVYIGSSFFRSTNPSDPNSYQLISGIGSSARGAAAFSDQDPNYCYLVTVGTISDKLVPAGSNRAGLNGFYKSTDGGVSFVEEVNEASQFFAPFSNLGNNTQGEYDMAIAVHPRNKDRVFIGGVGFAEWTLNEGPKMVGNNFDGPTNPFGIHADKHFITFDNPSDTTVDPVMFICTDGGVFRTTNDELNRYKSLNIGFTTTQFYGVAASTGGRIIGGTQDNNTLLVTKESYPRKNGQVVIGGDGFRTEISQYNPLIMFGESQYGNMRRSIAGGVDMGSIWDNRIRSAFASANQPNGIFNTPMELWENPIYVDSVKLFGPNEEWDSKIGARLFMMMNDGVWMCNNAYGSGFNPDKPSNDNIRWFKISGTTGVHQLQVTADGNSLFVGRTNGSIFRIDGLNTADFDTTKLVAYNAISSDLTTTNISGNLNIGGRTVTGIATDKADPNRVIITVGSYGNSTYVFETDNALDAVPAWRGIQGNLLAFPVYHAIISEDDPKTVILGTEFGIWATNVGTSGTPNWAEANTGKVTSTPFPRVPVFEIVQVKEKPWSGAKIYAGTHGMGFWESSSLLTNVKETSNKSAGTVKAYPNPANNFLNLQTDIKGAYTLTIYNLNGQAVTTQKGNTNGNISITTADIANGNYFVEVLGSNNKAVSKIIVQH
jgi:hypothetical protein